MLQTLNLPTVVNVKDGTNNIEKLEDNLLDNVYEAVLKQAYHMYRLFHSTFANAKDIDTLKSTLQTFFNIVSYRFKKNVVRLFLLKDLIFLFIYIYIFSPYQY